MPEPPTDGVRVAELVATLSYAADLGLGQPMAHCMRQTVIALRLADLVGATRGTRGDLLPRAHDQRVLPRGCNRAGELVWRRYRGQGGGLRNPGNEPGAACVVPPPSRRRARQRTRTGPPTCWF